MASIDRIDSIILGKLRENSRQTYGDIARQVGLGESATRRRIQNMQKQGIIKRFTVELGDIDNTQAIILISIDSSIDTHDASTVLIDVPGVQIVYEVTGQYDITAVISGRSISDINDTIDSIRKISGVIDTNSVIILRTYS